MVIPQPIRSTTQTWIKTRHQYGISEFVPRMLFCWETSGTVRSRNDGCFFSNGFKDWRVCKNFPHKENQAVWKAISKELGWNLVEMHNAAIKTSYVLICCLQCLWKPSKVRQVCWLAMLVRSSPSVHWLKEIRATTKNHTLQHVFSYLYINWKYPKLVQSQFYRSV